MGIFIKIDSMRYLLTIFFSFVFMSTYSMAPEFKIDGEWYVMGSTFPMWHKGDKLNPIFIYTPLKEGVWHDEVRFDKKNGKTGSYCGKDYLKGTNPYRYVWKGTGPLFFLSSKWQLEYISSDGSLMLVSFKKTAFSPSGVDVVCRRNALTQAEKEMMEKVVKEKLAGMKIKHSFAWINRVIRLEKT